MKFYFRFVLLFFCLTFVFCKTQLRSEIGTKAMKLTSELVEIGPRAPNSPGMMKARDWIVKTAKDSQFSITKRPFAAKTPIGFIQMENLSYLIPGTNHSRKVIVLAHYDSKLFSDKSFVGANDAASSVALLLTISPHIQKMSLPYDVEIIFVDGEEALVEWTYSDSLYGSRQAAQDIRDKSKISAVIVVDMVGDKNLQFIRSRGTDEKLLSFAEQSLQEMNQSDKLETKISYVMDDHTPFMEMEIPTLHLMDFTYGSNTTPGVYWHTENDTLANISADSLSITGELILRVLKKISA